jgi:tRNA dimethylallyltransferase
LRVAPKTYKFPFVLLHFLIGPTAVGKTALALEWAAAHNAEILCADAPLVYKGMDIGTAKPTHVEQEAVPHHGLDLVGIGERFNVGDYAAYAVGAIQDIERRKKNILIVGGSGFYLKSFFESVTDGIPVDAEISNRVEELFAKDGLAGLLAELRAKGGKDLEGLDIQNPRRVMKALERCLSSGKSFQELRQLFLVQKRPYTDYEKNMVMVAREKDDLRGRIARRVDAMIKTGLIDEVIRLKELGLEKNPQASSVIGYHETLEYLNGAAPHASSLDDLKAAIVQDTLALVRKQTTFFKQLPVEKTVLLKSGEPPKAERLYCDCL